MCFIIIFCLSDSVFIFSSWNLMMASFMKLCFTFSLGIVICFLPFNFFSFSHLCFCPFFLVLCSLHFGSFFYLLYVSFVFYACDLILGLSGLKFGWHFTSLIFLRIFLISILIVSEISEFQCMSAHPKHFQVRNWGFTIPFALRVLLFKFFLFRIVLFACANFAPLQLRSALSFLCLAFCFNFLLFALLLYFGFRASF